MHISMYTDRCVVGWGSACYTNTNLHKQRPAASVTSRPVPSVSRSVGTTTCVVDVKHVVPPKSSPPKKDTKSSKPSSPKVSPVHESDAAYFTGKTPKGKIKENQMHIFGLFICFLVPNYVFSTI